MTEREGLRVLRESLLVSVDTFSSVIQRLSPGEHHHLSSDTLTPDFLRVRIELDLLLLTTLQ